MRKPASGTIFVEAFEREFRTPHSSINRNEHGDEKESEEEERGTLQRRKRARTGGREQQQQQPQQLLLLLQQEEEMAERARARAEARRQEVNRAQEPEARAQALAAMKGGGAESFQIRVNSLDNSLILEVSFFLF